MKIGFTVSKGCFTTNLILFFTRSKVQVKPGVSHAFPIFGKKWNVEFAMSADELMSSIIDVNRYRKPGYVMRIYELPKRLPPEAWVKKSIERQNQKLYPWTELLWFGYRWFRRLFNPDWTGKNWVNLGREFCSEGTVKDMRNAGWIEELAHVNPNVIDPIELENIVKDLPGSVLIENWDA